MRVALKLLFAFGVSVISVPAHAQPQFPQTHSIESTVNNADLVFIAKLVDFREAEEGNGDKDRCS